MPLSPAAVASYLVKTTHKRLLAVVNDVDPERFLTSSGATAPSMAFHIWHLSRWADMLQARLAAMTHEMTRRLGPAEETWKAEDLTTAWGLPLAKLGGNDSGMGMDEEVSVTMPLPDKQTVLTYARSAFAAADAACRAADDEQFVADGEDLYGRQSSVGAAILSHLGHANRHLGSIEALKGLAGKKGTATV